MTEILVKKYVIIVAGGVGTRMNTTIPKQFLKLDGKPVVMHTIQKFVDANSEIEIILVLPSSQLNYWNQLCSEHNFNVKLKIADGGESRFYSVKNGLSLIDSDGVVAVHDAARPLVDTSIILKVFKAAEMYGSSVPAIPLNDSIRQIDSSRTIGVDRSKYCTVQTPQCFKIDLLKRAYEQEYKYTFTDDASVVESLGEQIHLIDGSVDNIKITTPRDLVIAEALLKYKPVITPSNKLKLPEHITVLNPMPTQSSEPNSAK